MAIDNEFFKKIKDMSIEQVVSELKTVPEQVMQRIESKALEICASSERCRWLGLDYKHIDNNDMEKAKVAAYRIFIEPPVRLILEWYNKVPIQEYAPA